MNFPARFMPQATQAAPSRNFEVEKRPSVHVGELWAASSWPFQSVLAPATPRYILGIFFGNVWGRLAYACNSIYFNDSLIF